MAPSAAVLILAELDEPSRAAIAAACTKAGYEPSVEPSAEAAIGKLAARKYEALIVHMGTPGAALASMKARGKLLRVRVPIIAVVDEENDDAFARAYRAGADEVIPFARAAALAPRLESIPKMAMPQPALSRGDAVVADPDRNRGEVLERVLRDAGFRVEVAVDGFAARLQAGRPSLKVAVIDAALEDPEVLIMHARAKGSRCAWVVRARPELLDEMRGKVNGLERVSVLSAYGPPDDVLFEANRLLETKAQDGRADARHLYGTLVTLRWKRDGSEDIGYTYNVSSVGLFVRTLAPPVGEEVTMIVTPPGGDKALTLQGTVAWRREFGHTRREGVPPGFAVRVTGGDIAEWTAACPAAVSVRPPMPAEPAKPPVAAAKVKVSEAVEGRATQSSVEEMLLSVLGDSKLDTVPPGSSPLALQGDSVTELKPEKPAMDPEIEAITRVLHDGRPPPPRKPSPERGEVKIPERPVSIRKPTDARPGTAGHSTAIGPVGAKPPVRPPPAAKQTALGVAPPPPPRTASPDGAHPAQQPAAATETPSSPTAAQTPRSPGVSPKPAAAALKRTAVGVAPPPLPKQPPPPAPKPSEEPAAKPTNEPTVKASEPHTGDTDRPTPPRAEELAETRRPPAPDEDLAETRRPPAAEALELAAAGHTRISGEGAPGPDADAAQQSRFALGQTMLAVVPAAPAVPREAVALDTGPEAARERLEEKPAAPAPTPAERSPELERAKSTAPRRGPSPLAWVGFGVVVLGIGAAIGLLFLKRAPAPTVARSSSAAASTKEVVTSLSVLPASPPTAAPTVAPSGTSTVALASAAPAPEPAAVPSAMPAAASAAPPAAGAAQPPAASEPGAAELATLPNGQGFLYVASPLATNVYVYGNLAGTTNQWIQTKCGPRFLRLGTAPGAWQGEGVVNIVKCGGTTRVEMGQ